MDLILELQARGFWLNSMLPIVTAVFLAISVLIQGRHLRAYEKEQRERAAEVHAANERTQRMFQKQIKFAAIAALIQAEAFANKAMASPPQQFHGLLDRLREFVNQDAEDMPATKSISPP